MKLAFSICSLISVVLFSFLTSTVFLKVFALTCIIILSRYILSPLLSLSIFNPINLDTFIFSVGFIVRPLLLCSQGDFYRADWGYNYNDFIEAIQSSLNLSILGLLSYYIGCYFSQLSFFSGRSVIKILSKSFRIESYRIFLITLSLLGFIGYFVYLLSSHSASVLGILSLIISPHRSGTYIYRSISFLVIYGFIFSLLMKHNAKDSFFRRINTILVVPSFIISLSFHDRKWFFLLLLLLLFWLSFVNSPEKNVQKKVSSRFAPVVKCFGIIISLSALLIILNNLRDFAYGLVAGSSLTGEVLSNEYFVNQFKQILLSGMFSFFDYQSRVIDSSASFFDSGIQLSFNYFLSSFIPSGLLEDKALPLNQIVAASWPLGTSATSPAISMFGESYIILGVAGVFIFPAIYAFISSSLYLQATSKYSTPWIKIQHTAFYMNFALVVRTGFLASLSSFLITFNTLLFALFLSNIFYYRSALNSHLR